MAGQYVLTFNEAAKTMKELVSGDHHTMSDSTTEKGALSVNYSVATWGALLKELDPYGIGFIVYTALILNTSQPNDIKGRSKDISHFVPPASTSYCYVER